MTLVHLILFIASGLNQAAAKKSVIPLNAAGGLRPLTVNLPQQQQDSTNPQGYPQPQAPALDVNPAQMPFGDQAQAPPAVQPLAPAPTSSQSFAQGPAEAPLQSPQQALDQAQGGAPQASEQSFAPQVAAPSNVQMPGPENVAAAFPMSKNFEYYYIGNLNLAKSRIDKSNYADKSLLIVQSTAVDKLLRMSK